MPQITPIAANSTHPRLVNPRPLSAAVAVAVPAGALAGGARGYSVWEFCEALQAQADPERADLHAGAAARGGRARRG